MEYQKAIRDADNAMWDVENHHNKPPYDMAKWEEELDKLEDAYEAAERQREKAEREYYKTVQN